MSNRLILPTLLLISDNPSIRHWAKKHLGVQFFIVEAPTRLKALGAIRTASFEFILLDAKVEEGQALALCKEIRPLVHSAMTPILLITDRLKKTFREEALDAGVTDFISSQLDTEELDTRIATLRRASQIRQKTTDVSSTLQQPKKEFPETYLKNKFLLTDQALRMLAESKTARVPISLLFLQIDGFAELQQNLGYLVAEELLLPFIHFLNRSLKETDLLIPTSEGRFILLLSYTSPREAKIIAETLRFEVEKHAFPVQQGKVQLTISIALTSLEASEPRFNQMIEAAMKALKTKGEHVCNLVLPFETP